MDAIKQIENAINEYDNAPTNWDEFPQDHAKNNEARSAAFEKIRDAVSALKAAAEQEPVAWMLKFDEETLLTEKQWEVDHWRSLNDNAYEITNLYTHPIASEDSERLAFVLEHGLPSKNIQNGKYAYPPSFKYERDTQIEAIDTARRS